MIIAFDFDGTLFEKRVPYDGEVGAPILVMHNALKVVHSLGHQVLVFTARSGKALTTAKTALEDHGLAYDAINVELVSSADGIAVTPGTKCYKPQYDMIVDDKDVHWISARYAAESLLKKVVEETLTHGNT